MNTGHLPINIIKYIHIILAAVQFGIVLIFGEGEGDVQEASSIKGRLDIYFVGNSYIKNSFCIL